MKSAKQRGKWESMYIRAKHFDFTDDELALIFSIANDDLVECEKLFYPDDDPDGGTEQRMSLLQSILDKIESNGLFN